MLYLETVEPHTFSILREVQSIPELSDFSLVGGTALSLHYGHRISEDLDLFSNVQFETDEVIHALINKFGEDFVSRSINPRFGIMGFVNNVKLDIISHPHPLIREIQKIDGIRFFSKEDIIAMKVQAILNRGKKKDFWDVAELLKHYTVADFVNFHKEKYSTQNLFISVPQALTYFVDADESADPVSLKGQTWESVKAFISGKVKEYLA
jgi:predicted nucleotidyltransferase component of viral defense system